MCNGIVISGISSSAGKTTISIGIMAALKNMGLRVQPFKAGPDFIDPGFHTLVTDRPSRNLDLWMCGEDYVLKCFSENIRDADMAIVEGVMGLFDGGEVSTAELAKVLGLPVLLIVNAGAMAESIAPIVRGFESFDSGVTVAGVILNRVGSERHFEILREAIDKHTNVKVLGFLPEKDEFGIPERHLGLTVAEERPVSDKEINSLSEAVSQYIDIEEVINIGTTHCPCL
ncbi:MAG: cobyrinate a,c-diamide synthase [Nitrospirae bacterium]|nr:cobyrinate a,c-diamide synthase [Nitrospirota bacterium]